MKSSGSAEWDDLRGTGHFSLKTQNDVPQKNLRVNLRLPSLYLAGLLALHNLEDGIFEGVVDKWCRRGLHVLLHQCAG